jgi:hypothetical protein
MNHASSLRELRRLYFREGSVIFFLLIALVLGIFAASNVHGVGLLYAAGGALLYSFEEYMTHVFVFHQRVPKHRGAYIALYRLHLGHHDRPRRVDLLFTPLWYTLPMFMLNAAAFLLVTRSEGKAAALLFGLVCGYLAFEWFHLVVHSPHRPGPILSYVRKQHHGHHYWNEKRWYSISPTALVFDVAFRTAGEMHLAPRSADPERSGVGHDDPRLVAARDFYRLKTDWTETESKLWAKSVTGLESSNA